MAFPFYKTLKNIFFEVQCGNESKLNILDHSLVQEIFGKSSFLRESGNYKLVKKENFNYGKYFFILMAPFFPIFSFGSYKAQDLKDISGLKLNVYFVVVC